ncbi:MAG TPA: hypothetical protein PL169_06340 [Leptospiraceae bacterium]|nr:hypothetical protein [Leptospiraceae bacterium]
MPESAEKGNGPEEMPKDFFLHFPYRGLNTLLYNFPIFPSESFSDFLEENSGYSRIVDYEFGKIYELMTEPNQNEFHESHHRLKNLLNSLSLSALSGLWLCQRERIKTLIETGKPVKTYFEMIQQGILGELYESILSNDIHREKEESDTLLLLFFGKKQLKKISGNERLKGSFSFFNESTDFCLQNCILFNPELRQILSREKRKIVDRLTGTDTEDGEDVDSILLNMVNVFQTGISEKGVSKKVPQQRYRLRNGALYLSLDCIIGFFKDLESDKRNRLIHAIQTDTVGSRMIHEKEMELLLILHKSNFSSLPSVIVQSGSRFST